MASERRSFISLIFIIVGKYCHCSAKRVPFRVRVGHYIWTLPLYITNV